MLAALIIVFREVIEAGLIVGIVLAATRGVPGRGTCECVKHPFVAPRKRRIWSSVALELTI